MKAEMTLSLRFGATGVMPKQYLANLLVATVADFDQEKFGHRIVEMFYSESLAYIKLVFLIILERIMENTFCL